MVKKEDLKKRIKNVLKDNPDGMQMKDIAKAVKVSRYKVAIPLAELKGEGMLTVREVGVSKLHFLKK